MTRYSNFGGNSGVSYYEYGADYINVKFSTGKVYTYSYSSAGSYHIERMKTLADQGRGLNSYIMKNVKNDFVR
jgi:hypothetical protein